MPICCELAGDMRFPLEGLHTETGPGVLEAAIQYSDALEGADRAALFKTFTKVLAERRGWMATFMAKWSRDWPGQSGHLHISLADRQGKPVFHDRTRKEHHISDEMRWFIGGQQALMPELLAMVASTVNSYTRLIPGFWAPTDATWGIDNRTCALRAIPGSPKSQRVEYRIAAADINPVPRARGRDRLRPVGHRAPYRARRRGRRAAPMRAPTRRSASCRARCGMRRSASRLAGRAAIVR